MEKYLRILDTEDEFILLMDNMEVGFTYGCFSTCIVNTDFNKMHDIIKNYLLQIPVPDLILKISNRKRNKDDIVKMALRKLKPLIFEAMEKELLNSNQANMITMLLMDEIIHIILSCKGETADIDDFIPVVFRYDEFHNYVRSVLLKDNSQISEFLSGLMTATDIPSSVMTDQSGFSCQYYQVENLFQFILLDLHKSFKLRQVNECEVCHRLFIPKYRKSEMYCSFNNSACKKMMKGKVDDPFALEAKNARGYQSQRVNNASTQKKYDSSFLRNLYDKWSADCGRLCKEYRLNDDLTSFKEWIASTKFTAKRLEEEWEDYNNSK